MKSKSVSVIIAIACIGWIMMCGYFAVEDERSRVRYEGKAAKENGFPINANPYTYDRDRDLWREGWRSGEVVRE